jgi:hypothetical protein
MAMALGVPSQHNGLKDRKFRQTEAASRLPGGDAGISFEKHE